MKNVSKIAFGIYSVGLVFCGMVLHFMYSVIARDIRAEPELALLSLAFILAVAGAAAVALAINEAYLITNKK